MNVQITARHSTASQSLKDSLTDEMERLEKYADGIASCHVILDTEHVDKIVEIAVKARRNTVIAKAHAETLGKAVDMALDKIKAQLKKLNAKRREHKADKDRFEGPEALPETADHAEAW